MIKKGQLPTHSTWKVAENLLGWRILSFERRFDDNWSFFSFPSSLSHTSIYMQSFDKFNCVLQFVFV